MIKLEITILCDNPNSWMMPHIDELSRVLSETNSVHVINDYHDIQRGDIAFFLSCEKIIPENYLQLNNHNIVVHASDLPKGRGFSPIVWQILEGHNEIPITLFEAVKELDAGQYYIKDRLNLDGTELNDEMRDKLGLKINDMILEYLTNHIDSEGYMQQGDSTFYPRRRQSDSEINPDKTLAEQFDLLRVVDNERYPAFFYFRGKKFILKIYKSDL